LHSERWSFKSRSKLNRVCPQTVSRTRFPRWPATSNIRHIHWEGLNNASEKAGEKPIFPCLLGLRCWMPSVPGLSFGRPPRLSPLLFRSVRILLQTRWNAVNSRQRCFNSRFQWCIDRNLLSVNKNINKLNSCAGRSLPQHLGAGFGLHMRR
jgi:hypothetical protein